MTANIIAGRLIKIGEYQLPASIIIFPITFIVGDLLTEFFGFKKTLKVIILGFLANVVFILISILVVNLPYPEDWNLATAYYNIFSFTPRLLVASFSAFLIGSIINSVLMVVIKKATKGKYFWMRTISSTIVGEFLDSIIFCVISFVGILSFEQIMYMILIQGSLKIAYEIVFTPVLYFIKNKYERKIEIEN